MPPAHGSRADATLLPGANLMTQPLHEWSAVRLVQALLARELSAQALAEALVGRIQALEPQLRAWAWFDPARTLQAAQALDAEARPRGVLHGLPLAPKDNIDTAGIPTAYGSPIYAGHVPQADAACVAMARAAGAYVMGKTASTELANMTAGPTRHPLQAGHTPGGSSSGSAAAVAAGLVPLALGTQTAGSVIRPASFCGVVGYKPSPRRIPRAGVKPNSETLDEVGVFARSVDDAALLAQVLAPGLLAGWPGVPMPGLEAAEGGHDVGNGIVLPSRCAEAPRIGVTLTPRAGALSPAMAAMVGDCARRLAGWYAPVQEALLPPSFDALFDAQALVQAFETARALSPEWLYRRERLSPQLAALVERGLRTDGAAYSAALAAGQAAAADLQDLFGRCDVLITPAAPGEAPAGLDFTGDPLFNRPWQLLGCPCITVPAGRGEHGLPLGLQIVARPQDDAWLFIAAAWIEARLADR
jgi:Asp-tRNA(Asn)/Glu-tRNA(Gln) amidotransferase A subunit family amidase